MTESVGTRPGGRTARVRQAVLRATGDLLAERGFAGLDLTELAERAGVGRTTVYRRWGSATELIRDLLESMAEDSLPRVDTGSLTGDLRANARLVRTTLSDPRQGRLFRALIMAGAGDEAAAEALHRFYATRIDEWAPCVTDAVARGELAEGTDARQVIQAVSAPLYYAFLASGEPLTEELADRAADAAIAAARVGVFD
ncbi:TetR/AcrR family transcriptional regulator [Enemella evansiae]|uniref:TetR/AcrR family transcriptional regulator n=1 Tax=Enemella evansiae TaxID=2016499 RepID=UPI000B977CBA|nr:TetR/AcrR family transcriptional regulator [Enemella evansiae]OYO10416.1 TetR family transcriptional regulator [Enemella evansiae]TDO86350.1 TetR family transcriptional regulator [Enemella evansiae]